MYTFTAIDPDTKLVPTWLVGRRDVATATTFLTDMGRRIVGDFQLSTDAAGFYQEAAMAAFGGHVAYAQIWKHSVPREEAKAVPKVERVPIVIHGRPDPARIGTSHVERHNLTMRMAMRRYTRRTNAFSKKVANHACAVATYVMHYNWVRPHRTLTRAAHGKPTTPAMAAGLADRPWRLVDLVKLLEAREDDAVAVARRRERSAGLVWQVLAHAVAPDVVGQALLCTALVGQFGQDGDHVPVVGPDGLGGLGGDLGRGVGAVVGRLDLLDRVGDPPQLDHETPAALRTRPVFNEGAADFLGGSRHGPSVQRALEPTPPGAGKIGGDQTRPLPPSYPLATCLQRVYTIRVSHATPTECPRPHASWQPSSLPAAACFIPFRSSPSLLTTPCPQPGPTGINLICHTQRCCQHPHLDLAVPPPLRHVRPPRVRGAFRPPLRNPNRCRRPAKNPTQAISRQPEPPEGVRAGER